MNSEAERRAVASLIYLVQEHAPLSAEIELPDGWRDRTSGQAVLLDRRGDRDVLRVVTQEEAIEFGQRARAVERELMPGPGRDG